MQLRSSLALLLLVLPLVAQKHLRMLLSKLKCCAMSRRLLWPRIIPTPRLVVFPPLFILCLILLLRNLRILISVSLCLIISRLINCLALSYILCYNSHTRTEVWLLSKSITVRLSDDDYDRLAYIISQMSKEFGFDLSLSFVIRHSILHLFDYYAGQEVPAF